MARPGQVDPSPTSELTGFDFTIDELDNALGSFEDVVEDPQVVTSTRVSRTEPGSVLGVNTACPEVFHQPVYSISQRSFQNSVGADERLRLSRRVYLFATIADAIDLFGALAVTPVGCDTSSVGSFEEIATSVEKSEFETLDAVTIELERIFDGDEVYTNKVEHWVRLENVVVYAQIGEGATDAVPLLSAALATVEALR